MSENQSIKEMREKSHELAILIAKETVKKSYPDTKCREARMMENRVYVNEFSKLTRAFLNIS